ncbi:Gfo/Idh/MocA family oxidoreductase [Neobacillus sp. PS3-34]|uniref:Gfo/Idh/MocA family protein n=1 Tax=Neobacillus sp. PS3-34 TaxID=3070678 RepID=UPI0027E02B12|nr:Gfo/Idh/MocA family oxidoreductase [Neobacillus sp. PS3-34]WML48305.1 Gfo/Idh/MocA family oxidoreductase [Neobacillus sp. PS3-34]
MLNSKINVGIIGCGNISSIYIENLQKFEHVNLVALSDLQLEKARLQADKYNVPIIYTPEELLNDKGIDIVVNLTTPEAHYAVSEQILLSHKHVYVEKPLTIEKEDAQKLITLARQNNVRIGCAPDTFLGGAIQTARELIEKGAIGKPIAAHAFMLCHGHESWHPAPHFYYKHGGGPLFDMGPYYLTALINLIGPVRRVAAMANITFPERTITSKPNFGATIHVETPTHINGVLEFENGAIGNLVTSFDIWHTKLPCIEIYGTEGTMMVPDPNGYNGVIQIKKKGEKEWKDQPITFGYTDNSRGIGVSDMAHAIIYGEKHRANEEVAFHVLDIMHSILDAADKGRHINLASTCEKPKLMDHTKNLVE